MVWQHTSLVTGGPLKASNADAFFVGPQQPVERAVDLTITWDTMALMWRHCNVQNSYHIVVMFVLLQGATFTAITVAWRCSSLSIQRYLAINSNRIDYSVR